ncbi:hypothetical protein HDU97_002581 [Phlyctochytrium planicorne]|nr:hypothetical protein HDU97_002581 [Phlyctochytrium planicorne]
MLLPSTSSSTSIKSLVIPEFRSFTLDYEELSSLASAKGSSIPETLTLSSTFANQLNSSIAVFADDISKRISAVLADGNAQTQKASIQGILDCAMVNHAAILDLLSVHKESTGVDLSPLFVDKLQNLAVYTDSFWSLKESFSIQSTVIPKSPAGTLFIWPPPSVASGSTISILSQLSNISSLEAFISTSSLLAPTSTSISASDGWVKWSVVVEKGTFSALTKLQSAAKANLLYQIAAADASNTAVSTHVATVLCEDGIPTKFWDAFMPFLKDAKLYLLSIQPLSKLSNPLAYELELFSSSDINPSTLNPAILKFGTEFHVDIVIQPVSLFRTRKRLAIFDMDSTLIQQEVIDELAREAGVVDQVSVSTNEC